MAGYERVRDRASARGRQLIAESGKQLHVARLGAGLSQSAVARAAGVSRSVVSRVERGLEDGVPIPVLVRLFAAVGLKLAIRGFPDGDPVRDASHVRLLGRLRAALPAGNVWKTEVPLPIPGDSRAWDAMTDAGPSHVGVEAETRVSDAQAVVRRTKLKQRDGLVDRVLLLVADTPHNRAAVAAAHDVFWNAFPIKGPAFLRALREGRDPGGDGLLFL